MFGLSLPIAVTALHLAGGVFSDAPPAVESRELVFACGHGRIPVRVNPVTLVSEFGWRPHAFRSQSAAISEHFIAVKANNGGTIWINRDTNTLLHVVQQRRANDGRVLHAATVITSPK
jgi:hypothetical protein